MAFVNMLLRTIQCSSVRTLVQEGGSWSLLKVLRQLTPSRRIMISHHLRKEDVKSEPNETLDLEEWKSILKSGIESYETKKTETQEDPSLNGMRELVEMWRLAGRAVPQSITTEQLQVLMELPTKTARKKYLKYLSVREIIKTNQKEKKKELKESSKSKMENLDQFETKEGNPEKKNTFLLHVWDKSIDTVQRWKCAQAMKFGLPLVFDMVYEKYMSRYELENTVCQLMESEGWNRRNADPFHIYFCNLQSGGPYHKELVKRYMGAWDNIFITATDKPHVEMFPKEQLVYLTADSPNELIHFDPTKIYIIGSLVDKCQQTGLSLANAKRLNLATARLPLDRYLKWDVGAKNLTLDQMIRILLCLKDTGDWKKALSFVPTRKHDGFVERAASKKRNFIHFKNDGAVEHAPSMKENLLKSSKTYEFGKSKSFIKPERTQDSSIRSTRKRWWE
ncbi:tRNA methyltransferase 10 homolog C [Xenopus laevis]|uniref:tRNA methyltransferase 10 homolog C n=2 Tax=Xenopus laevis TaxID=8355 RepID=A0A1L8HGN1_XENLA|nr:tRNA methyltransferase 10 homolog C [Xenopus laevis]XP_018102507.1 tRNA methyltransferase 10 homolog C [Xenopus laevis]XP_018102508.1 tRNA methyltransferase 10 homolog C [Xenopus laevis]OCT95181.1 hypothetical protein XELAEV_18012866mg [Xenopus laevis]